MSTLCPGSILRIPGRSLEDFMTLKSRRFLWRGSLSSFRRGIFCVAYIRRGRIDQPPRIREDRASSSDRPYDDSFFRISKCAGLSQNGASRAAASRSRSALWPAILLSVVQPSSPSGYPTTRESCPDSALDTIRASPQSRSLLPKYGASLRPMALRRTFRFARRRRTEKHRPRPK